MSSSANFDVVARNAGPPSPAEPDGTVTLRVSGGKPMHLRAQLLAEGSNWTQGDVMWQEVAVYELTAGDFAVSLNIHGGLGGDSGAFHARLFTTLDDAMAWLQDFDPAADLGADIDASDRRISATDIALRACALRQRADRMKLQYRGLIGELLYRLDLGE